MSGYWELWDVDTANLVADFATEPEALALVRELIGKGWPVAHLSLLFEDPDVDVDDLPPAIAGEDLARRAEAAGDNPVRRTA